MVAAESTVTVFSIPDTVTLRHWPVSTTVSADAADAHDAVIAGDGLVVPDTGHADVAAGRSDRLEDRPVVGVVGAGLVAAFRHRQPHVEVLINEADLSDPTAGLRAGLVAVALTRTPFDGKGISTYVLRSDPVGGVTLRAR
jgi:hypothetical protein